MTIFYLCVYGIFGWCIEIVFTALVDAVRMRDVRLKGTTYLWMFPIYGLGGLLFHAIHTQMLFYGIPMFIRLPAYLAGLYIMELSAGLLLVRITGTYVWYYEGVWQYRNLINFAYAPAWLLYLIALEELHRFLLQISFN